MFHLIPIAVGVTVVAGLTWIFTRKTPVIRTPPIPVTTAIVPPIRTDLHRALVEASMPENLVEVILDGIPWLVAPDYIGPVGIGEAADIAKASGFELPTPALVDAIWRQADLKLLPLPRQNIVTQAVFDDQKRRITEQIAGRPFRLLGGSFKDVVVVNGFPQLYGWHVEDGKNIGIPLHAPVTKGPGRVIQPPSGKAHGMFFKDYSQGVRLVKRKDVA
jgi:hypothetical protein